MWLESSHIILLANPYSSPLLFTKKKCRGGLCLYVNYSTLIENTMTDAWPLLHINDLLSRLKGA